MNITLRMIILLCFFLLLQVVCQVHNSSPCCKFRRIHSLFMNHSSLPVLSCLLVYNMSNSVKSYLLSYPFLCYSVVIVNKLSSLKTMFFSANKSAVADKRSSSPVCLSTRPSSSVSSNSNNSTCTNRSTSPNLSASEGSPFCNTYTKVRLNLPNYLGLILFEICK